jgi:hypothetical protein
MRPARWTCLAKEPQPYPASHLPPSTAANHLPPQQTTCLLAPHFQQHAVLARRLPLAQRRGHAAARLHHAELAAGLGRLLGGGGGEVRVRAFACGGEEGGGWEGGVCAWLCECVGWGRGRGRRWRGHTVNVEALQCMPLSSPRESIYAYNTQIDSSTHCRPYECTASSMHALPPPCMSCLPMHALPPPCMHSLPHACPASPCPCMHCRPMHALPPP